MNILFLCTANVHRSRTAEDYFKEASPNTYTFLSAGLSEKECTRNGSRLCTIELLEWSDKVFVMEEAHKTRIAEHTGDRFIDKIHVLDIDDIYQYNQPELVLLLKEKVRLGLS